MVRAFFFCVVAAALLPVAAGQHVQTAEGLPAYEVPATPAALEPAGQARHVILMIGDGMGMEHVWAAWACNRGKLHLERMPVNGWSRTSSASHAITDSAAGGTAIACGERTSNGTVGQSPQGEPFCSVATELKAQGWATGLVVTKSMTDATPAAFYAHAASRRDTARIASQLEGAGFSVLLGGGADDVPAEVQERLRGRGVLAEFAAPHNMPPATQRGDYLPRAVERALAVLGEGDRPFFLMVEGSWIDLAAHDNNLRETVAEVQDFDRSLGVVLTWLAAHPDALVVVLADHQTGGLSLLGADVAAGRVQGSFSTRQHSGLAVPVYAAGAGAQHFSGMYDNRGVLPRIRRACAPQQMHQPAVKEGS